jgi:hypothetical protein
MDQGSVKKRNCQDCAPTSWWESAVLQQVWIHSTDGRTIRGFVKIVAVDGVLLADAEYLDDNGTTVQLGGEAFIPKERVNWVQIPATPRVISS